MLREYSNREVEKGEEREYLSNLSFKEEKSEIKRNVKGFVEVESPTMDEISRIMEEPKKKITLKIWESTPTFGCDKDNSMIHEYEYEDKSLPCERIRKNSDTDQVLQLFGFDCNNVTCSLREVVGSQGNDIYEGSLLNYPTTLKTFLSSPLFQTDSIHSNSNISHSLSFHLYIYIYIYIVMRRIVEGKQKRRKSV